MKCISIKQPWAWLIVHGHKDIENRDWLTRYRGPVAIHAGKYVPTPEELFYIKSQFGIDVPRAQLQFGGIVGKSEIIDCVEEHESRWFFGAYGFVLRNSVPVDFIAYKGALGLFDVPFVLN
jgi:hypothetical protein